METVKYLFQEVLHLKICTLSIPYMFSGAMESPDHFMPSIIRVNNIKDE